MGNNALEQMFEALKKRYELIEDDLIILDTHRVVYRRVVEIIQSNPTINKPNIFYEVFSVSYWQSCALAVRRQLDEDKRAASLMNILTKLEKNSAQITKDWWLTYFGWLGDEIEHEAREWFDEYTIPEDPDILSKKLVAQDIEELKRVSNEVTTFANKVVAHRELRAKDDPPVQTANIDKSVDALCALIRKYTLLIANKTLADTKASILDDWTSIFRTPWLAGSK